jgi:putative hemolysin
MLVMGRAYRGIMMLRRKNRPNLFPELSYANENQPRLKQWFIRSVEGLSGRDRFAALYASWRDEVAAGSERVFSRLLELLDLKIDLAGSWPPPAVPGTPLVMVANHPFGIGDGVAILALAEQLGRPFRVMIHSDLLKVPEMVPYALPIDFSETKEAVKRNLAVRNEAVRLLKEGVTIVIFPAGGVATAPRIVGQALDLPWKLFVAKLVLDAKASVLPIHFRGQNGRLFHLVSRPMHLAERETRLPRMIGNLSLTLRLSLLVREFARLAGGSIEARIGDVLTWDELSMLRDRKLLLERLKRSVTELAPPPRPRRRLRRPGFRAVGPAQTA